MPSNVVYSPLAQSDLDRIFDYISDELANPSAALNTVNGILNRIELLATFPDSGTPLSSIYPIATDYRFVVSGNYLAFYRHKENVYIDRILYAGSDYLKTLFKANTVNS